jgi:hypothetical protein
MYDDITILCTFCLDTLSVEHKYTVVDEQIFSKGRYAFFSALLVEVLYITCQTCIVH